MEFTESVYNGITLILNKERRGVVKPSQITGAIELAYDEILIELTGEFKKSGIVPSSLEFYVTNDTLTFSSGLADTPTDYMDSGSLVYDEEVMVDIVDNDMEWADRLSSKLIPPSEEYPIARVLKDKIQISPNTMTTGFVFNYIERPDAWFSITWTVDGDGRGKTINTITDYVKFKKNLIPEAIKKALVYMGATLSLGSENN